MKLEQYQKATPLVTSIEEAQFLLDEMTENKELLASCGSVKIQAFGKEGYRNIGKTINVKNSQVQKLVLQAVQNALKDMIRDHKKQLEQI